MLLFKGKYLHKLFGILHWSFVSSFSFMLLFNPLRCGHLFYTLSYNWTALQLYLDAEVAPPLAIRNFFSWPFCSFDITSFLQVCCFVSFFKAPHYFLILHDSPIGIFWIFSLPFLGSTIYPRSSGFFYWIMVLEIKIWVLGMLTATTWHCFWSHLTEQEHICVYTNLYIFTYLKKSTVYV